MFDPNAILGGLLQGALRSPSMGRVEHAMGERGLGGPGGPLGQILSQLGGGTAGGRASRPQSGGGGGILDDLSGLSRSLGSGGHSGARPATGREAAIGGLGPLAEAVLSGRGGAGAGSGGLGGVLGSVLGGALGGSGSGQQRRPSGLPGGMGSGLGGPNMRGALGAGALAVLGMLAMRALRQGGQSQAASTGATRVADDGGDEATLPDRAVSQDTALLVLRAMIEAAKADGRIDETEQQRIAGKLQEDGADQEGVAFVQRHAAGPPDPAGLVAEVPDQVVAAQVYAASLLAIKVDTQAERAYLRELAQRLGLDPATVAQLHQALGAPA